MIWKENLFGGLFNCYSRRGWKSALRKSLAPTILKPFTLSAELEKDYSIWSNTEAEAIINIYKERRKLVFLLLFGGFGCYTVSLYSAGFRDKSCCFCYT